MPDDAEDVVRRERFSGGPARTMLSSLDADERIFEADLAVDRAHVVGLAEAGVIDASEAAAILHALDEVAAAGHDALPAGEDVHAAIETAVVDRAGTAGGTLQTARSRNDEVAACIRYRFRADLLDAAAATVALRSALATVAADHVESVMPGYTHLQPAQPTTVGHFLASYATAVARDTDRLLAAYDRTNRSPLGAAAFAGTPFDLDRERTAALLGFDGVVENAMDAASARDFLLEATAGLATHATTLSGLAEDLVVFARDGDLRVDDDYASTSSIMPQKVNPDTLELVRATAGDAHAGLSGLLTTLKGLPRAYNRDLQRATPHAWETVDATVEAAETAAGAVATATWDTESLADRAGDGFTTATAVADRLARAGVPFRTAHEVVATAAEAIEGIEGDCTTPDVETLDAAAREVLGDPLSAHVDPASVERVLSPTESVAERDSRGGPAPETVRDHLDGITAAIETDRTAVERRRTTLDEAAATLEEAIAAYV